MNPLRMPITGLLRGRITRRSLLAAVLPAAGVSLAWAGDKCDDKGRFSLGGSWIATEEGTGLTMEELITPLDPEGKTATLQGAAINYGTQLPGLLEAFGADAFSPFVGHMVMTGRDTAKAGEVAYLVASAKTPPTIVAIVYISNQFRFTDPDTMISHYTSSVYPPSADGLPHGKPIVGPISGATVTNKRVPLLCTL